MGEMVPPRIDHEILKPEPGDIMLPYPSVNDLPHAAILWGLFDPELFQQNRNNLLRLKRILPSNSKALRLISDKEVAPFIDFLTNRDAWVDVRTQISEVLSIQNDTRILPSYDITSSLRLQLERAQGNIVLFGTPHSVSYPIHEALRLTTTNPEMNVAELVLDKHIDTVVNPRYPYVTSASVYHFLSRENLIRYPIIIGPDPRLMDIYKKSEYVNQTRAVIIGVENQDDSQDEGLAVEILGNLKERGITNITICVDMDVLSKKEAAYAVRYSSLMHLLGLGCQKLPELFRPSHIEAVTCLAYPTAEVQHFLQRSHIVRAQDPQLIRQGAVNSVMTPSKADTLFTKEEMDTHIGEGKGLPLSRVLSFIQHYRKAAAAYDIEFGITLKGGGHYVGSIVELMGFDDQQEKTTKAALTIREALLTK